jgi:hypothetical protein
VVVVAAAVGCGGDSTPEVSGKITFRGNPIPLGSVMFVGSDGNAIDAHLGDDGRYSIRPARVGPMKVVVTAGPTPPPKAGAKPGPAPAALPAKYGKRETTDLTVELKPGSNEFSYDIP